MHLFCYDKRFSTMVPNEIIKIALKTNYSGLPQQCLCFFPLPQGQGSLRPGLRLVYAWFLEERRIVLFELYHKNDKENEDRQRILDNFGS